MGSSAPAPDSDEPVTPAGRLFLQPQMNQIIYCVIGFKNPIDIDSIKSQVKSSLMLTHPRFSSLMVRDSHGRERWHKTTGVDVDRHVIILHDPVSDVGVDDETAVNNYLADLSTGPGLPTDKPMWEVHLLIAHKVMVFRIHHALGDGISLMSMFLASCRRADDEGKLPTLASGKSKLSKGANRNKSFWGLVWGVLVMVWFSLVFVVEFVLRSLWVCDRKTEICGGDGVELWPRKLATAKFGLQDMKLVKKAVPHATINDVLFGVISSGISRYLDHRKPNALPEGVQITGVAMVNLRKQPGLQELSDLMRSNSGSSWGNKFGMLLLPIYYHNSKSNADPLAYLKRSKVMIDKKKQSVEGHFSYKIGLFVMTYLGPKVATLLNYRILCNTSFTISNILGPQEEITLGGNPITFLRASSSSLPHALTLHMVSYAERADMQILVAKDIIPDPAFLAKCFEEALLDMKEAAAAITKS
ncbi:wax ester synthase/diacylglycerol acyltransferase 5-like [Argentina anserina]|uniref:wax ester synthase/diacylglycerol acyltransferase 5-like n=1 Tax=Argentina anserina TaxID=57926 RepID=UPI0021764063|nr:wax ester synthase/diacylglycerol acyltransferase 5-like [Potentilla anserina]